MGTRTFGRRDLLGALATVSCSRHSSDAREKEASAALTLGVARLRISLPIFLAVERGLFEKRGLEVDLRLFDTAQPMADELAAGRLEAGGYVALPILFDPGRPRPDVRVLTAIVEDAAHRLSYLLVRKASGWTAWDALRGRRIGILPTLAYRHWLEAVLSHEGVPTSSVSVVPISPPLQVEALERGGVDALFTGDPMATAALSRGVASLLSPSPEVPRALGDPFVFGTFAVTNALVRGRPAALRALSAALDDAIAVIARDPLHAADAMVPYVRGPERPFVRQYPPTRYLQSHELLRYQLDHALALAGATARAADISVP